MMNLKTQLVLLVLISSPLCFAQLPSCNTYPVEVNADPVSQILAETQLENFAPGSSMSWRFDRGTFQSITDMAVELADCTGEATVQDSIEPLIDTYPDLFQIDLSNWRVRSPVPCANVSTIGTSLFYDQHKLGNQVMNRGIMSFRVVKTESGIQLRNIFATYIPLASESLEAILASCPDLPKNTARDLILNADYPYSTFSVCIFAGSGNYIANSNDSMVLSQHYWIWSEDPANNRVLLRKQQTFDLLVDRSNVTDELYTSDAYCPFFNQLLATGIGFQTTVDSVDQSVLFTSPGIGCLVC